MTHQRYCPYQWLARISIRCHHCGRPIVKGEDLVARAYPNCCQSHAWKSIKWTGKASGTGNYVCANCVTALGLEVLKRQHPEDEGTQESLL
jgi:DNA-directed RNA polymerase subunit RPC12/RpoP